MSSLLAALVTLTPERFELEQERVHETCVFKPELHIACSSLSCTRASAVVPGLFQLFAVGGIDLVVFRLFAAETLQLLATCRSIYNQTKCYRVWYTRQDFERERLVDRERIFRTLLA